MKVGSKGAQEGCESVIVNGWGYRQWNGGLLMLFVSEDTRADFMAYYGRLIEEYGLLVRTSFGKGATSVPIPT